MDSSCHYPNGCHSVREVISGMVQERVLDFSKRQRGNVIGEGRDRLGKRMDFQIGPRSNSSLCHLLAV